METVQASRVTGACNKLLAAGPIIRGRPLQYVDSPQLELDSFSIFTVAITMRVSAYKQPMLHVPHRQRYLEYQCIRGWSTSHQSVLHLYCCYYARPVTIGTLSGCKCLYVTL